MFVIVLIVQVILLFIEFCIYINDQKAIKELYYFSPIINRHDKILFTTLLIEAIVVITIWILQGQNRIASLFLTASPLVLLIRAGLHFLYLDEITKENDLKKQGTRG